MWVSQGTSGAKWNLIKKYLPNSKVDIELFTNGDGNTYDSVWWSLSDAQRNTIARRVLKQIPRKVNASVDDVPYSMRLKADRSTGKAAGAVIYCRNTGRCLWAKRSNTGDAPGVWASLGGGVDPGETIVQGLRRELVEEGGFRDKVAFVPFYVQRNPGFSYYNFVGTVDEEFEPTLNDEHTEYVWSEEVPTPCHPGLEAALRDPRYRQALDKFRARVAANTITAKGGQKGQVRWLDKAERKQAQKPKANQWEPPEGFFKGTPDAIGGGLKQNSEDYAEAARRLSFYINRAGKNLSSADKDRLGRAKDSLKRMYGRDKEDVKARLVSNKVQLISGRRPGKVTASKMPYEDAKRAVMKVQELERKYGDVLKHILKDVPRSNMGLTPDHIRATKPYQIAKSNYDRAFAELQRMNQWFTRTYKAEYRADRAKNGRNVWKT